MRLIYLTGLCLLFCFAVLFTEAQTPANDNCSSAEFVYLDATGNICFNSSNQFASGDGVSNVCDAGAILPLPPGGHEVWFTYIASGSINTITITPTGANAAQKVSVTVTNGNCAVGGTNVCNTGLNPPDPASTAFSIAAGTQIWFSVTSLIADGDFQVCINSVTGFLAPGTTCSSSTPICNTLNFSCPGSAVNSTSTTPSCFNSPPKRTLWYKFTPGTTGPLEFTATPNNVGGFRWALYDITAGCPGAELTCNAIYNPLQPFGLSSTAANCTTTPYCPPVNVTAGNTYALMVDDTSQTNSGFEFNWTPGIKLLPTADFSVDSTIACGTLTLNITNLSTYNNSTTWSVDFGDLSAPATGTGSSFVVPPHTFTAGVYLVTMTVAQPGGCSNTYTKQITVNPKPSSAWASSGNDFCFDGSNPISADFTPTLSSFTAIYDWSYPGNNGVVGIGIGSNTVYWNIAGTIPVSLVITENGCVSDTTKGNIRIHVVPASTFDLPDTVCTGQTVTVQYTGTASSAAIFAWTYGTGTTSNVTNQSFDIVWNAATTDQITLAVQDSGCLSFPTAINTTVFTTPSINVLAPVRTCVGDTITVSPLANGPANLTYNWTFFNSSLIGGNAVDASTGTFTFPTAGSAYWKGTAVSAEGCASNSDSVAFTVYPTPTSTFTASPKQICGSDSSLVVYTGTGTALGSYNWNFGGANSLSGNAAGPYTLTFPAAGTYYFTLAVTENQCVSDTTLDSIIVANYPIANAGVDTSGCSLTAITIGSTNVAGLTYSWTPVNFLNNTTASNPLMTAINFGTEDTTLRYIVAATQGFCTSYDTMFAVIHPRQQAFFINPDQQCQRESSFDFIPDGVIVPGASFTWSFGANATPDSAFVASPSGIHFNTAGNQSVTLTTQSIGCPVSTYTGSVFVKISPVAIADASVTSGCPALIVPFTNLSPALANSTLLWDFGNGDTSTVNNPTYTYLTSGIYYPTLTIISQDTCSTSDSLNTPINVSPVPNPTFTAIPPVTYNIQPNIVFDYPIGNINCFYDFGDGTTDSSCYATHTYADTGSYVVTLIVQNANGCIDSSSQIVTVKTFYTLYIPTAFTPNKDFKNEELKIYSYGVTDFSMDVFNRRGQIVWRSDDVNQTWNGNYLDTDTECPTGIYVYKAKIRDANLKRHQVTGRITIIR
ncbi:hypothetical protein BH11BAC2_BH11BAC2_05140 [soil metagenome]